MYKKIDECLACGFGNLVTILDLKSQPLANNLKDQSKLFPLKLKLCESCYHAQLSISVNPETLFLDYLYISGTSMTLKNYFKKFASEYLKSNPNTKSILDIACNDGSQLLEFEAIEKNLNLVGIDPAKGALDLIDSSSRIKKINGFWPMSIGEKFDLIIMQNVLAHSGDPLSMLAEAFKHLNDCGKVVVQTSQCNMFSNGEFDTIYHEHISFFNFNSMNKLVNRAGLFIESCKVEDIHGSSYVFTLSKKQNTDIESIPRYLFEKNEINQYSKDYYLDYVSLVEKKIKLLCSINKLPNLVGLGAAAKATVALNAANMDNILFLLDENPLKIGKKVRVGESYKGIYGLDCLDKDLRYNIIIFAWNFREELIKKMNFFRGGVDKYITVYPYFKN